MLRIVLCLFSLVIFSGFAGSIPPRWEGCGPSLKGLPINQFTVQKLAPLAEELRTLLQEDQSPLWQQRYYQILDSDPGNLELYLQQLYGSHASPLIDAFKQELGSKYLALLGDPGLANRLADFLKFAKGQNLKSEKGISVWKARQLYSDSLGFKKVYRGIKLSAQHLDEIVSGGKGLFSQGYRTSPERIKKMSGELATFFPLFPFIPRENIAPHQVGRHWGLISYYMSTTESPELAASAGHYSGGQPTFIEDPPGQKQSLYVMKLRVPELALLYPENLFACFNCAKSGVKVGDKLIKEREVEQFIPYYIPREQILEISPVVNIPPAWEPVE